MIISTASSGDDFPDGEIDGILGVELRRLVVDAGGHGVRLDKWLTQAVTGFSRSYLQQLVESGAVQVRDAVVFKSSQKLRVGDPVTVELRPTEQSKAFVPQAMPIDVVYEDGDLCVVNKAAGLVVHPAPGNWTGTLLNGLLARDACFGEVPRAGIVHRLDKDTSGLMVVAKNRPTMDRLVSAIAARDVSRHYVAIARGPWTGGRAFRQVDSPIGRDPANRLRMAVVDLRTQAGKPARTDIRCLEAGADRIWVHCQLHTGRTHQIRVHMAAIGCPLVADAVYGGPIGRAIGRQALHAFRLAFRHPTTGAMLDLKALPPTDFLAELEAAGLRYNDPDHSSQGA